MTGEREALIAQAAYALKVGHYDDESFDAIAEAALDAFLSVRGAAPCPRLEYTVDGIGYHPPAKRGEVNEPCPSCHGSGSVDTGPLLVTSEEHEAALAMLRRVRDPSRGGASDDPGD